jgi:hypothetical protein
MKEYKKRKHTEGKDPPPPNRLRKDRSNNGDGLAKDIKRAGQDTNEIQKLSTRLTRA